MQIDCATLLKLSLSPRNLLYFENNSLNSLEPHFHVILGFGNGDFILLGVLTSQFKKQSRYIELNKLPMSTLVAIKKGNHNKLTKDFSYVNCNSVQEVTKDRLLQICENTNIKLKGEVSESEFEQIKIGVKDSPLISDDIKQKYF